MVTGSSIGTTLLNLSNSYIYQHIESIPNLLIFKDFIFCDVTLPECSPMQFNTLVLTYSCMNIYTHMYSFSMLLTGYVNEVWSSHTILHWMAWNGSCLNSDLSGARCLASLSSLLPKSRYLTVNWNTTNTHVSTWRKNYYLSTVHRNMNQVLCPAIILIREILSENVYIKL